MGFQTGDIVKANVSNGKYAGTYTGRIAIRFKPSFKLTAGGKSFDVHPKYLQIIHKADGNAYLYIGGNSPHTAEKVADSLGTLAAS